MESSKLSKSFDKHVSKLLLNYGTFKWVCCSEVTQFDTLPLITQQLKAWTIHIRGYIFAFVSQMAMQTVNLECRLLFHVAKMIWQLESGTAWEIAVVFIFAPAAGAALRAFTLLLSFIFLLSSTTKPCISYGICFWECMWNLVWIWVPNKLSSQTWQVQDCYWWRYWSVRDLLPNIHNINNYRVVFRKQ